MNMINDGGPAFPTLTYDQVAASNGIGISVTDHPGMTLRDYFAGMAMAALIAEPLNEGESSTAWRWTSQLLLSGPDTFAHAAYMMADAMLRAREASND